MEFVREKDSGKDRVDIFQVRGGGLGVSVGVSDAESRDHPTQRHSWSSRTGSNA